MALCDFQNVSRIYPRGADGLMALHDVTLAIEPGDFVSVTGPSGSGKSTLLHILGLLDRPTLGTYRHLERDVSTYDDNALSRIRNKTIGFIFQSFNLFPQLNVLENVEVPMIYAGVSAAARRRRSVELVERVGLKPRSTHRPTELSGGEMQRVAVARALANEPVLLLADEPTGNLDEATGNEIVKLLLELNGRGTTLIVVTHNPDIARLAGRSVRLRDGRMTA
ncbi:MAG: macrolide ABC transporter ATP-binding protein [Planctomycetes bacterium RBG_16_59_8]|nr:MAG: macrolide ABC transporter ATP-binding protein [Planctomycetes bacterium RBG_16_59_8]